MGSIRPYILYGMFCLVRGCVLGVTIGQLLQSLRRVLIVGVLILVVGQDLVVPVRVARIVLAGQELVSTNVFNTKALCFSRNVCRFEAWALMAQVGGFAKDDQASTAGVTAGLVLEANDVSRFVVVKGHLVGVVVVYLVCYRRW